MEVGYTLARDAWGRGYATEAARAWVEQGFTVLGLPAVVAMADPANAASLHVLGKLGMTRAADRQAYGRPHAFFCLAREAGGQAGR